MVEGVGDDGIVIWGVGDRSTKAAQLRNAKDTLRESPFSLRRLETESTTPNAPPNSTRLWRSSTESPRLEEIRFENGRVFNYSAVVEAMILSGFGDIDPGEGGAFQSEGIE